MGGGEEEGKIYTEQIHRSASGLLLDDAEYDREECGPSRKEAKDDPEMGVPERLVGPVPGIEKTGGSNSSRLALRNRKDKPISYGNKSVGG